MKLLPINVLPCEKLELYGEESLSLEELLAIILKTGTKEKTVVRIAQEILSYDYENVGLAFLRNLSLEEILSSPRAKAIYDGFTEHKCVEDLCKRCMRASYYR